MNKTRTLTILALTALVLGAAASPALAQDDDGSDRPGPRDDRHDRMGDARDGNRSREAGAHVAERCRAYYNETGEVPEACERARDAYQLLQRCRDADENATDLPPACDRLKEAHDGAHMARRAAHAILRAIDALEHRIDRIDDREARIQAELDSGNLTDENATKAEQHLERLQAAENRTLERIDHLQARLDAIQARWDAAADHVADYRAKHGGSDDDADESEDESEDSDDDSADADDSDDASDAEGS